MYWACQVAATARRLQYTCGKTHPELDIDYFFTDTGKELPEVYEFLVKLEGFLGKSIERLNPDRDFDFWLKAIQPLPTVCTEPLVYAAT